MLFFFFNDTATTEIYTLSLHDALPILARHVGRGARHEIGEDAGERDEEHHPDDLERRVRSGDAKRLRVLARSEEHTSELQSQSNLVCRLLLEKKKQKHIPLPLKPC